jgi:replicative DNA helicase
MTDQPEHLANLEAERTVIGSVLIDNSAMDQLAALLTPKMFCDPRHVAIWTALLDLYAHSSPLDIVTLKNELAGGLDGHAGGVAYIASLIDGVPRVQNPELWAKIVIERARRRSVIAISKIAIQDAMEPEIQTDAVLGRLSEQLARITSEKSETSRTVDKVLPHTITKIEAFQLADGGIQGIPCGLADVDHLTGGWKNAALYILGGRPSRGKSTFCSQAAVHAASRGYSVLFFGMEMPDIDLVERMLLSEARVDKWRELRKRPGEPQNEAAWARISQAYGTLSRLAITFEDREFPSLAQIKAAATQHKSRGNCDMIVVDYLQRCALPPGKEMWQGVGEVAAGLKTLARALNVAVLAACQLSSEAEEKRPTLSNLAQSRQIIAAEADLIAFLHPEDPANWRQHEFPQINLIVDKHRHGPCAVIPLSFEKATSRFLCMGPKEVL